ncbi:MAG: hypothetical protein M1832_006041 [Thelocarpon impressellum]|nr:MAG: hypothetical protein M1832_006041 [Thelocarpon impressellum]
MEPLTLKARQPEEGIECWDDDEDLQGDDFHFRTASVATTNTSTSAQPIHHRDSVSSRLSLRSDLESNATGDERQVHLPGDDEESTFDAIASAAKAGIPIPKNVPSSALVGGTIKRLGGKRSRKVVGDDWGEDLELPGFDGGLTIKKKDGAGFPDALRQFSSGSTKSLQQSKPQGGLSFAEHMEIRRGDAPSSKLNKFRDDDADFDDLDGDNVPTIKVAKHTPARKPLTFPPLPPPTDATTDDFEQDLEFPADGQCLRLPSRKEVLKTPSNQQDEFEEWADGSLGTRYGGTRNDGRSNRSSSLSAMSPSVSSIFTVESEDEGLDGLVLPEGPLHLDDILKKRQQNISPDPADYSGERQAAKRAAAKDDFFSGLEIADGDVFESGKLTLNRNVKHKSTRPTSPARRTAMTLTFTNKPQPSQTRIPRLMSGPDRTTSSLESVSERGSAMNARRPQSRMSGHSPQSSISSIPTPSTPSSSRSNAPSTPSRLRNLGSRPSLKTLRPEPTTTSAQLLKLKRSMPTMNTPQQSPAKATSGYHRPPSRSEAGSRQMGPSRPKTPVERSGADSSLGHSRRQQVIPPVPFLPAGTSHSTSHHISSKTSRQFKRHDSESSATSATDLPPRSMSRASRSTMRSPSPQRRRVLAPESLAREAAAKRTLTRPKKTRNFGDGSELEVFDDLPTSASSESKLVKLPIGRGAPKVMRSKLGLNLQAPDERAETPTPLSPGKSEYTPRFARDTNASRIAREQRIGPLGPTTTNWKAQVPGRGLAAPSPAVTRSKRRHVGGQQKPHLIKPLGDTHNSAKSVKGMQYNPTLFRWEGNENALAPFDAPLPPPSQTSPLSHAAHGPAEASSRFEGGASQRPALITNINTASPTVQVVGGMVFDPQRMCWLKLSQQQSAADEEADDSDDPFAGLDDLDEGGRPSREAQTAEAGAGATKGAGAAKGADEWLVGEEFDVGPEFVRRQRDEEERWRRKVSAWVCGGDADARESDEWRWGIRDVVAGRL